MYIFMKLWILQHHVEILNLRVGSLFLGGKKKRVLIQNFPHNKSFITLWRDTSGCHHIKEMLRTGFRHPPLHRQTTATAGPCSQTPLRGRCHIQSPGWDTQATPTHTHTHTLVHTISRWWDALTHTHTTCSAHVVLQVFISKAFYSRDGWRTCEQADGVWSSSRIYVLSLWAASGGLHEIMGLKSAVRK